MGATCSCKQDGASGWPGPQACRSGVCRAWDWAIATCSLLWSSLLSKQVRVHCAQLWVHSFKEEWPKAHDLLTCSLALPLFCGSWLFRQLLVLLMQLLPCALPGSLTALVHQTRRSDGCLSTEQVGLAGIIMRAGRTSPCIAKPRQADSLILACGAAGSTMNASGACTPAQRSSSAASPSGGPAGSSASRLGAGPARACGHLISEHL